MNLLPCQPQRSRCCYFCRGLDSEASGTHTFPTSAFDFQANGLGEGAGNEVMAHLNALLRSARSRIGRRLAQIVDIAAASLPTAGA